MKDIYDEFQEIENKIWKLESKLNEGYMKDRLFDIRYKLILTLLKIRERL